MRRSGTWTDVEKLAGYRLAASGWRPERAPFSESEPPGSLGGKPGAPESRFAEFNPSGPFGDRPGTADDESVLLAVLLVLALGLVMAGVLALLGAAESRIAAAHRDSFETRYAAESALDRAVLELEAYPAWDDLLGGVATSSLTVGAGVVAGPGRTVDLATETARLQARTDAGPNRGGDTPRWQPFLWAPLGLLAPPGSDLDSPLVVAAWVADDEAERDGNAGEDSNQAVWVCAMAFGPGHTSYRVEALVTRPGPGAGPLRRLVWRGFPGAD